MQFTGVDYVPELDQKRLTKQHEVIKQLMLDGVWRSLSEISRLTGFSEASISAQLRHLRKPRFGSYKVNKVRSGDPRQGLFVYQVVQPKIDFIQTRFA